MRRRAAKIFAAAAAVLCLFSAAGCRGGQTPLYAMIRLPDGSIVEGPVKSKIVTPLMTKIEFEGGAVYVTALVNICFSRNAPGAE